MNVRDRTESKYPSIVFLSIFDTLVVFLEDFFLKKRIETTKRACSITQHKKRSKMPSIHVLNTKAHALS